MITFTPRFAIQFSDGRFAVATPDRLDDAGNYVFSDIDAWDAGTYIWPTQFCKDTADAIRQAMVVDRIDEQGVYRWTSLHPDYAATAKVVELVLTAPQAEDAP